MEFKSSYDLYRKFVISCNIVRICEIKNIFLGSGGSQNLILHVLPKGIKEAPDLIIKVMPHPVYYNAKVKPDLTQLEIKFYQFFTKKYLLTDRTPHIVGIYNQQKCQPFSKLIESLIRTPCPTYEDRLTKELKLTMLDNNLCRLQDETQHKLMEPTFDAVLLEFCNGNLAHMISYYMNGIKSTKATKQKMVVEDFVSDLQRVLFQLIFTLALIKTDYPGFYHGDFFVRNILLKHHTDSTANEYVAYHYQQRIFYLPATGIYAKMNDFGTSILVDELVPNTYNEARKLYDKMRHLDPFNRKNDIFNLLHDIYDGQNLGTQSINRLIQILKIPAVVMKPIRQLLRTFIDLDTIDKINTINAVLLDQTWNINDIKVLEKTVMTPEQYLKSEIFRPYQILPKEGVVIRHYNEP